ncbi:hypothetical protein N790_04000 [Arenimonas malthae CC-JY-1]|uniref:Uncharacterized protein n=1 Tax=Arenimonas malthae CC-JY-1 TaxID=1384054 RepID=A0A091BLN5_9GAMM|nr:DUF6498-containing protein [Arenimonas malthae]KFN51724.1 hypothetical protein N790_04000 [Arenimonas malthae CC-JY-1]
MKAISRDDGTGLAGILGANALTLVLALWQDWSVALLAWPFWLQSVVIGWYARRRMLALKDFSVEGFRVNGRQAEATPETLRSTANFFLMHYGFFHLGYLVFLLAEGDRLAPLDMALVAGTTVAFWLGHRRSHELNLEADTRSRRNLGALMFLPYVRVVPMHLAILLGAASGDSAWALVFFTGLKTAADAALHAVEHRWLRAPAKT